MNWLSSHIASSFREPITWGDLCAIAIVTSILRAFA
jgi:hypothetical protein